MNTPTADIVSAALLLSESERLEIAHQLFASVPPPKTLNQDDPNFEDGLKQRLEYEDEELVDHEEAMRRMRAAVGTVRNEGQKR